MKKRAGFTLAEVLITLGIIGVVAAITIPSLINNANEAEYNTSAKKIYSELSQALLAIISLNGGENIGTNPGDVTNPLLRDDFATVMNFVKKGTEYDLVPSYTYTLYKSNTVLYGPVSSGSLRAAGITASGVYLLIRNQSACIPAGTVSDCGYIIVDTNGTKKPNMMGKDVLRFTIAKDANGAFKIIPVGTVGYTYAELPAGCSNPSVAQTTSEGCTALRLTDPDHMP